MLLTAIVVIALIWGIVITFLTVSQYRECVRFDREIKGLRSLIFRNLGNLRK